MSVYACDISFMLEFAAGVQNMQAHAQDTCVNAGKLVSSAFHDGRVCHVIAGICDLDDLRGQQASTETS